MKFVIHCDACGRHIVTAGETAKLTEIKTAPIPGGVPIYNKEKKQTDYKKSFNRPKMFKCPKCGRGVAARKMFVIESNHIEEKKDETKTEFDGRETGSIG